MLKQSLQQSGTESFDARYHRLVFKWAGHVQRIGLHDEDRLTFQMLRFKSWSWIQGVAAAHGGAQLHGRRLHVWRWERPLYKFFATQGCTWESAAEDKTRWTDLLDTMVAWRCSNR